MDNNTAFVAVIAIWALYEGWKRLLEFLAAPL